jgi:16S rRNA A1518/A1519 N6-dimethyltransferase RsmA/KsgA/DIM1 with predicted DNA glycosylase/AP lyase activity
VAIAGVGPGEQVYDLGAGTGRVTAALVAAGARVVAVERDPTLAAKLVTRFGGSDVRVLNEDLTQAALEPPYSVVANLPFNVTAAALRRLLVQGPAPDVATLVLQREAARKWAGAPWPTAISLSVQPWFAFEVLTPFDRRDFVPAPAVEVAVLRIVRRADPLVEADRPAWEAFVRYAFARRGSDSRSVFRNLLSNTQWRRLSEELAIAGGTDRSELTLAQWVGVFRFVQRHIPPWKRLRISRRD